MVIAWLLLISAAAPEGEFQAAALRYADFMLAEGRDHYGEVRSPLFAGSLLIGNPPSLLPDAIYGDAARNQDIRVVLNLPNIYKSGNLAHKITYRGGDLADDAGLLHLLYSISRKTGDPRYANAADEAIRWFLAHCIIAETGLPAWGEHSGWDFRRERADHTGPPYQHHEFDSDWPFYAKFVELSPKVKAGEWTLLERWSRALWEGAVFEKDGRLMYCRHSALFVKGRPSGGEYAQFGMFPRHGGYYVKHWAVSLANSTNPEFIRFMETRLDRFLAMLEAQVKAHGYPTYEEKGRIEFVPGQVAGMASSLEEAAGLLPRYSSRLMRLAAACDQALVSAKAPLPAGEALDRFRAHPQGPGAAYFRSRFFQHADQLAALTGLAERTLASKGRKYNQPGRIPEQYAGAIDTLVEAARLAPEAPVYLSAAKRFGREAMARFLTPAAPLPRALDRPPVLLDGSVFPDFYHSYLGGDDLMWSLWRLGEALR